MHNLNQTFERDSANEVKALIDVSLTLMPGDFVTVVGMNGSGKSTLLNLVAGALPTRLGHHQARWRRRDEAGRTPARATCRARVPGSAQGHGAQPHDRREPLARARPGEQPVLAAVGADVGAAGGTAGAGAIAVTSGLEDRLDAKMGTLSGGERQALTLLMATLVKPSLLLLDEHTAALDPRSVEQVVKLTERVVSSQRLTTLMVTHSMHQAVRLGDRVLMMHRGRVVREIRGREKQQLRVENLLATFDQLRSMELLDESAADMLRRLYV